MNHLSFVSILTCFCLGFGIQNKAASQSKTTPEAFAFAKENGNNKVHTSSKAAPKMVFSELSPAHNQAFQFVSERKILVLNHTLPKFVSKAVVHIQDVTGRNIRTISINPKEAAGMIIPLSDLLAGTYHYVLILDTGRKIQATFEIEE